MGLFSLASSSRKRVFGLDLLRFFAIFFVLYNHSAYYFPSKYRDIYKRLMFDGVSIFFVLSGFLIGSIIIKSLLVEDINIKKLVTFWKQRWSRTLPNYFLFLLINILIDCFFDSAKYASVYYEYVLFIQNLNYNVKFDFYQNSWSLCVEEWFYLLVPFLIIGLIKTNIVQPKKAFIIVCILTICFVNVVRVIKFFNYPPTFRGSYDDISYALSCRLDGIMYGMIGAYVHHHHKYLWEKLKYPGLILGTLCLTIHFFTPYVENMYFRGMFVYTFDSIITLSFLPLLFSFKVNDTKLGKLVTYISLISYSLYLVNSLWIYMMKQASPMWNKINHLIERNISSQNSWGLISSLNYILFWVMSIFISAFIYKYFEVPTTNYLRRKNKD